jgi:nucleotide-binding universal stress UspA family protein
MFKHILVPLDGSPRAELALPVAAQIARYSGSPLLLVQVIPSLDYGGLVAAPLETGELIETELKEATDYLNTIAAAPILAGIETTIEVRFGLPTQEILAVAESRGVDLIVACSHGKSGFTDLLLGNVAYKLIHLSPVPVLMLHEESEATSLQPRSNPTRPLCALVPLDGSQIGEMALVPAVHLVAALAAPDQGELHLVHVVKISPITAEKGFVSEPDAEALQIASAYLAQVEERLRTTVKELNLSIIASVEPGTDVAGTLISMVEQGKKGEGTEDIAGCDLIALSTSDRGGLKHLVMGSVTERILKATKLPVLIVRPQKVEQE